MENIYQACTDCDKGKIHKYSKKNKYINISIILTIAIAAYFFFTAAANIIADKLIDKEILLSDLRVKQLFIAAIFAGIVALPSHYFYNILAHLKSWLTKDCPYCEQGYIIAQRTSNIQAIIYFFDLFIFQQVLLPMYKTLTFQFLWNTRKTHIIIKIGKAIFYSCIFFGAIPFMIFLLGRDQLSGLVISVLVMIYILSLLFFGNKEDRTYQKGTIFLIIPLYYVCMVEIFRWAWFLSTKDMSIIPDQSSFLWMGLENMIRTQLFMDLFEVYDLGITNISATTFLTHSSIFVTRLIIDVALIAMLIQMAVDSYRRAWHFKFTGEKIENITEGETLTDLESLAITGSPNNIHDVKENLEKVISIIEQVKPYVNSVKEVAHDEEDRKAAQECNEKISQIKTTKQKSEKITFNIRLLQRVLAVSFVLAWLSSFSLGINSFIHNVISHEISILMEAAEREQFALDPIARQNFYLKAVSKNPEYHPAVWKSAQTFLKMASSNLNLLDTNTALNNIEKYFEQITHLQTLPEYEEMYQEKATILQGKAYMFRGVSFLLEGRISLAIAELRRRKNKTNKRITFNIMLISASQKIFSNDAKYLLNNAYNELGFDPKNDSLIYAKLLNTILFGQQNQWGKIISELSHLIDDKQIKERDLDLYFSLYLAQVCMREGSRYYKQAEKYFEKVLKSDATNKEAILGISNLYRLMKKYDLCIEYLAKHQKNSLYRPTVHIIKGEIEKALPLLQHIEKYEIRERLKKSLPEYLQGKISEKELLETAYSWDIDLNKRQQSLVYFYIAINNIKNGSFGKVGQYLREVIFWKQESLLEYRQAKLEFENLQITLERKSYQSNLFFQQKYFSFLNKLIQKQLHKIISPEKKAIEGLKLIMNSPYIKNKLRAIRSLTTKQIVSPENFLPFLKQAIQSNHSELKKVALSGFFSIGKTSIKAKKLIEVELENKREDIRLACIKVFSTWQQESIPSLLLALKNENSYVKRDAAYVIAQLGPIAKDAISNLAELLMDKEAMVRFAVFTAIRQIGAPYNKETLLNTALYQKNEDLRLAALTEIEIYYNELFVTYEKEFSAFLVDILLKNKDGENRKWAAIRLLIYQNKKTLNSPKVFVELKQRITESLASRNLDEKLRAAIWLLNTYDKWKQKYEPAIDAIISRWLIGDDQDQRNVSQKFLSQVKDPIKINILLRKAFSYKNAMIRDIAQITVENIVLGKNFSAKHLASFFAELAQSKDIDIQNRVSKMILFAIQKNPKASIPVFITFLTNKKVHEYFLIALTTEKIEYSLNLPEIKFIIDGLKQSSFVRGNMSKLTFHFQIKTPELFPIYSKLLLKSKDKKILTQNIVLLSLYSEKKENVDKVFHKLAKILAKNEDLILAKLLLEKWLQIVTIEEFYKISQKYAFLEPLCPKILFSKLLSHAVKENEITDSLFLWMKSKNSFTATNATSLLPKLKVWPAKVLSILLELVQSSEINVGNEAQRVLLEMTSIYNINDLKSWLEDSSPIIRAAAIKAVGKMGIRAKEIFPDVAKLLKSNHPKVQKAIIHTFGKIGKPIIVHIKKALTTGSNIENQNAISCLREMNNRDSETAIKTIIANISEKEDPFTIPMFEALEQHVAIRFQPLILPMLEKMTLQSEKAKVLYWSLMHAVGEKELALQKLVELLESSTKNSEEILKRLITIAPDYVLTYLKKALKERYRKVNIMHAMNTLKGLKNASQAKIILEEIAEDPNPKIRARAKDIMEFIEKNKN